MEKIGIYVFHPGNDSTRDMNCNIHISLTNCREHKFVNPSTSVKAYTLPPVYPDKINFQPPTLPQNWGDKGAEGKQKIATQMTAWITTFLIIITLLAILYTIFKKCRYVSSLPRVCFPLYPFSTIL